MKHIEKHTWKIRKSKKKQGKSSINFVINLMILLLPAYICMMGGYVFTVVCLFRGGSPSQVQVGGTHSQVWGEYPVSGLGRGVPGLRSGGVYLVSGPGGVPGLRSRGVPGLRSRGVPSLRSQGTWSQFLGGTPCQVWGVPIVPPSSKGENF